MISVKEAKDIVFANCKKLGSVEVRLVDSIGYALSEDIYSPINIPSFRQSSMDGYAIRFSETNQELLIEDSLPAGTDRHIFLSPGCTIKVFTGGPVPDGADTVIPKEMVELTGQSIKIKTSLPIDANIRIPGSDICQGDIAIHTNTVMNPMLMGFLASMGFASIKVIRKPKVAIVISGNELVLPGLVLDKGQVYESNSFSLRASLQKESISQIWVSYVNDDLTETENRIREAMYYADIVLITGGVSVGDFDFVATACKNLGIETQFHGVKQRPGKPLYFGTKNEKLIWGLPGNPSSVLSCYGQYVLPAIHRLTGTNMPPAVKAKLTESYEKKTGLTFFLKGYYHQGTVSILSAQASYQLNAFARANCWVEIGERETIVGKESEVNVYLFA